MVVLASCLTLVIPPESQGDGVFYTTNIDVDDSKLKDWSDDEMLRDVIIYRLGEELSKRYRVPIVKDGGQVTLLVNLTWEDYEATHWRIKVQVMQQGKTNPSHVFMCKENCFGEHDIANRIIKEFPTIVPDLERPLPPIPDDTSGEPVLRRKVKLHAMGWAGVGLGVAGMAAGAIGGVLLPRTRSVFAYDDRVGGNSNERKHSLALTTSLAAGGGVLFVMGAGLLIADLVKGDRARRTKTSWVPFLSPGQAGLTLTRKF